MDPFLATVLLILALVLAFGFEAINGFHDTSNAVTTVIYTRTLRPTTAVVYSGIMNFLGALVTVMVMSAAVAFSIVNLLPVDILVDSNPGAALVMVVSLLLAGVIWNLGTWYIGLPVSSSHTLIGSIIGVGMAHSLWSGNGISGVNWSKAADVGLALLFSPMFGFLAAASLLLIMRRVLTDPRLYVPPQGEERPPWWIRCTLIFTSGGVSFAHGSNDGQKGMGLLLLVLIGFLPVHYALNVNNPEMAPDVRAAVMEIEAEFLGRGISMPGKLAEDLKYVQVQLDGKASFKELDKERWPLRQAINRINRVLKDFEKKPEALSQGMAEKLKEIRTKKLAPSIEFVPLWVVIGTAFALGIGTMFGYKRVMKTVAEKIGKKHLTYAQGAVAEFVAMLTIFLADLFKAPVSTTQVLSSGVAGTMVANKSGVQGGTIGKILMAWLLTLPVCAILAAVLFMTGQMLIR